MRAIFTTGILSECDVRTGGAAEDGSADREEAVDKRYAYISCRAWQTPPACRSSPAIDALDQWHKEMAGIRPAIQIYFAFLPAPVASSFSLITA
jgi:hypothetical protein